MWLIISLASLVTLFLLVLSVPLDLAFRLDVYEKTRFSGKLVWLFGLVEKELGGGKKKTEPKEAKEKKIDAKRVLGILRTEGLPRRTKILVTDVFNSLRITQLSVDFRIGLDNPADTGLLFAFIGPTMALSGPPDRYSINIEPSFEDEAILEGYTHAVVRLLPIRLVIPILKFVFSLPALRVIKTEFLAKWKRKK